MRARFLAAGPVPILFCYLAACSDPAGQLPTEPLSVGAAATACSLGVPDDEAISLIDELSAAVAYLRTSGALTAGQANALLTHLASARKEILEQDYCTAAVHLRTFRTQVQNFVGDGVLTEEEAETLLGGATDVLEGYPHFASISSGHLHTCALTEAGNAWCWGSNVDGRLGDGTTVRRLHPTPVAQDLTFSAISAGDRHTCGLTTDGDVWCWGGKAVLGEVFGLGDGNSTSSTVPVLVGPTMNLTFAQLSAGTDHSCGVTTGGGGYCWGYNGLGQIGDGTETNALLPVVVGPGLELEFSEIDAGEGAFGNFTCGVTTDHRAFCWGNNTVFGWLGDGSVIGDASYGGSYWPVQVGPGMGLSFAKIDAGAAHACALTTNGAAYCWGANGAGQLGNGVADFPVGQNIDNTKTHRLPEPVAGEHVFLAIEAGGTPLLDFSDNFSYRSHTCGVTTGQAVLCWGLNWFGQVGDGTTTDRLTPTAVPTVPGGYWKVSAGAAHSCALSTFGRAYCWGFNGAGQLGDGTTTDHIVPKPVRFE